MRCAKQNTLWYAVVAEVIVVCGAYIQESRESPEQTTDQLAPYELPHARAPNDAMRVAAKDDWNASDAQNQVDTGREVVAQHEDGIRLITANLLDERGIPKPQETV